MIINYLFQSYQMVMFLHYTRVDIIMKIPILEFIILIFISINIFSCIGGERPPISNSELWGCQNQVEWNSTEIGFVLIGEWEWEFISCYGNPQNANNDDFLGMVVKFNSDNTLQVKMNGEEIENSTWEIISRTDDLFQLEVNPFVSQISGRILICDNRIQFNDSYRDACDNYWVRIK